MDNSTNGTGGASTHDVTTAAICRPTNSITLNQRLVVAYVVSISFGGQLGQTLTLFLSSRCSPISLHLSTKSAGNCTHPGYRVNVPSVTTPSDARLCYQYYVITVIRHTHLRSPCLLYPGEFSLHAATLFYSLLFYILCRSNDLHICRFCFSSVLCII